MAVGYTNSPVQRTPTRFAPRHRAVGGALFGRCILWHLAGFWGERFWRNPRGVFPVFRHRDTPGLRKYPRAAGELARRGRRVPPQRARAAGVFGLRARDRNVRVEACGRGHGVRSRPRDARCPARTRGRAWLARLRRGAGAISSVQSSHARAVVGLSRRPPELHTGNPDGAQRRHCGVSPGAQVGWRGLLPCVGEKLGLYRLVELRALRSDRHSPGPCAWIYPLRPRLGALENAAAVCAWRFVLYRVARRISVSRNSAESAFEKFEE